MASVPTTEKANALASVSDHRDVIVPGVSSQTVSKDTTTTGEVSGQAVSDGSGKKRKIVAKNALHNTTKTLKDPPASRNLRRSHNGLSKPQADKSQSLTFIFNVHDYDLSIVNNSDCPFHQICKLFFSLSSAEITKKRILLPKPTASSNVVSIPLSSIISQTIGVPQGVHSKSRDAPVSVEDTLHGNREKEMKTKKSRERSFACLRCSTKTTTRQALWKHKRRFHSHEPQEGKTAERVSCDDAMLSVGLYPLYNTDIKIVHQGVTYCILLA
ncbi:hypothetical protein BSL78_00392 [Apostichopus japonicus]|uniref:C2H2-type domain-containing protein n=1 Tax=Stichopus japonicus TaxID=307972 RepID=A0A2G8LR04_STIJA|nr:hypothetical protein BSL78_00392 [Apostichopus japonicus]